MKALREILKKAFIVSFLALFISPNALGAEQAKVTFGYSTLGAMATGSWMAKEIGSFDKYGIQAELIYIASGPLVVQALLGGDLHGGIAASNAVINAILNGAPIIGVAGTANRPYHRLFVQPGINRIEDLRGKTLGVTRFGSITDNLTRILLRRYGLEGVVQIRQLGGTPEVGAAFAQRFIVGAVSSDLRVPGDASPKVLLKLVDLDIPYSMNMIPVSREFLRRHTQTVEGMVKAYAEGVAALHDRKEKALQIIAKYSRLTDRKNLEDHYQDSITYLEQVPRAEPQAMVTILEFMGKKNIPLETIFDNSIIDRLVREGFMDKLRKKS